MKAVIDTNVVFAGLANRKGAAYKIFQRFFLRQFEWVNSKQILDEYHGVLSISEKLSQTTVDIFLSLLERNSITVEIPGQLEVCKDSDDDKFLETAIRGDADYLVTKNLKHFPKKSYQGVRIVKVATFLQALETASPGPYKQG